ncbi:hypothetical protein [Micrococcus terreus]|uniref:Uncharacterized protein n=1 Tax=Micrococcus terreus TaxID=574650 RepID=A0A1I7MHA1_9MICC|nr:hypothetical protein [Micrococcus terreus]SFV21291.1 hypothetical protein SAMN04487966_102280 [Micrococcus terreus]
MPQPTLPRSHRHPVVDALTNILLTVALFAAVYSPTIIAGPS